MLGILHETLFAWGSLGSALSFALPQDIQREASEHYDIAWFGRQRDGYNSICLKFSRS